MPFVPRVRPQPQQMPPHFHPRLPCSDQIEPPTRPQQLPGMVLLLPQMVPVAVQA